MLTVLNNFGATALSEASAPDVVVALQSLIGCFDLDPNRVFDLVLDRRVNARPASGSCSQLHLGLAKKIALHSSFRAPLAARWRCKRTMDRLV